MIVEAGIRILHVLRTVAEGGWLRRQKNRRQIKGVGGWPQNQISSISIASQPVVVW